MGGLDSPKASPKSGGTNPALKHQVQQFFDEWSIRFIGSSLGKTWTPQRIVASALHILALNGVPLQPYEISEMAAMDETTMITELCKKMPHHVSMNFESLALQLQMMVAAATRIRKAAEDNDVEVLATCCDGKEGDSMRQAVLKRATVSAAQEIGKLQKTADSWTRSSDARIVRLQQAAVNAERAHTQLAAVETQLEAHHESAKSKSSKFLVGMVSGQAKVILQAVVGAWYSQMIKGRAEKHIRERLEKELEAVEAKVLEYKQKALENVRGVLSRATEGKDKDLMSTVVRVWSQEVADAKAEKQNAEEAAAMEARLKSFSQAQTEGAKKVLARMNAGGDMGCLGLAMQAWLKFSEDYKKDKDAEEALKKVERDMKAMMEKNKANATSVLDRMNGATESGLKELYFSEWAECIREEKRQKEMDKAMKASQDKFKNLKLRQSNAAMNCQGRVNDMQNALLLVKVMGGWTMTTRLDHVDKYYSGKMDSKRKQLQSVQQIFKTFAKQLEQGFAKFEDEKLSARMSGRKDGTHRSRRSHGSGDHHHDHRGGRMSKGGNSTSLPDIHKTSLPDIHSRHEVLY